MLPAPECGILPLFGVLVWCMLLFRSFLYQIVSGIEFGALAKRKRRFRIERKRPFAPSGTAHLHLYTAGVRRSEWKQKIRFTFRPDFAIITPAEYAPVAQLDRVTDSDSVGQRFESARAYHEKPLEA